MTKEELAQHDGKNGRKAYVAINDLVYDVSDSPLWQDGDHQGAQQAGRDLTKELRKARHVQAVLEKFPVVAYLDDAPGMSAQTAKKTNQVMFFFFLIIAAAGAYFLLP
ncbi:cytochrome b5 domain-containing protein [Trichloromonas sp.]|uniref:cytochrome b5 domain-containing protein n=1 Tax=Trichloromonas sp. TaxID=3069249 RepID=UPI003D814796